jgi:hypothetical protein
MHCTRTRSRCGNSRDLEASWALDVHEERVWLGNNLLQLVGSSLSLGGSVEEVDSESLGGVSLLAKIGSRHGGNPFSNSV